MFIAINTYVKKLERSQIKILMLNLKKLEKEDQTKPKGNKRKDIIKIRVEVNEIETRKTIQRINVTKTWFSKKINKNWQIFS